MFPALNAYVVGVCVFLLWRCSWQHTLSWHQHTFQCAAIESSSLALPPPASHYQGFYLPFLSPGVFQRQSHLLPPPPFLRRKVLPTMSAEVCSLLEPSSPRDAWKVLCLGCNKDIAKRQAALHLHKEHPCSNDMVRGWHIYNDFNAVKATKNFDTWSLFSVAW